MDGPLPHPVQPAFDNHAALHLFVDVVDENDGISYHQPAHAVLLMNAVKPKVLWVMREPERRARSAQGKCRHHNQRVNQRAELERENQNKSAPGW